MRTHSMNVNKEHANKQQKTSFTFLKEKTKFKYNRRAQKDDNIKSIFVPEEYGLV